MIRRREMGRRALGFEGDGSAHPKASLRLPRDLYERIADFAEIEGIGSFAEAMRQLLRRGLESCDC